MAFFTQSRCPVLWKIFQYCMGGTTDKRKLAIRNYKKQRNILEVGCSLGNIAGVFKKNPNIKYTGIDIDPKAIKYAQKDYASFPNFRFLCMELKDFIKQNDEQFDYILFAGILHHVDYETCRNLFKSVRIIMSNDGLLVVTDPLLPRKDDSWFIRFFVKFERGKYIRNESEMQIIIQNIQGFQLRSAETYFIGPAPILAPKCARFGVYTFSKLI